ncbi:MAG: phosphoenolpyruvate carboxykinase (ATP), partial [Eggerthellaceae bacterium]|nr:phosphoenolpyruvate carboxykinase (ATP) [Eggerthellaceae bacterium]
MSFPDLAQYGISNTTEIVYNPSYEQLYEEELDPNLTGFDVGMTTELDAVNVFTGEFTGRSPKDKYVVLDENSKDTVWWTSEAYPNDNHVMSEEVWDAVRSIAV